MKKLLFVIATTLIATSASAQSAFEGFYGQIATGYESNQASNLNTTFTILGASDGFSGSNQTFGGAPLVLGLGYNFSVVSNWLLGIGADYSALSQKSSTFSQALTSGVDYANSGGTTSSNGSQLTLSNRLNIFLTPGYAIDKDRLVYLKAGYSSVSLKETMPSSLTEFGNTGNLASFPSQTQTLSGYIVGLGYKQMLTDGFYGFAEANYMSYGQKTYTSSSVSNGLTATFSNSPNLTTYQALLGVGYKF